MALIIYQAGVAAGAAVFADDRDRWFFVVILAIGAVLATAGLSLARQSPMLSGGLIAVGVVPSIIMFWMIVPPIIALGVAIYAVLNGRNHQRQPGVGT